MIKEKLLITGATGNVGKALINFIDFNKFDVTAGVRNIEKARTKLPDKRIVFEEIDFESRTGLDKINKYSYFFLLRPPQIGNVGKFISPFIDEISKISESRIIFLSVQGAENKGYLPHSKIEKMIIEKKISYIFVRPGYFMDNLVTTLHSEIDKNRRIFLPSGKLKLNWIDVNDVGEICARLFDQFNEFIDTGITVTNNINLSFHEVVRMINEICNSDIRYESPNLIKYIYYMKKEKKSIGYIAIMLLLHFLPRFEKEPIIYESIKMILKKESRSLTDFIERNRNAFLRK